MHSLGSQRKNNIDNLNSCGCPISIQTSQQRSAPAPQWWPCTSPALTPTHPPACPPAGRNQKEFEQKRKARLLLQLLNGLLSKFSAGLGLLQLGAQSLDLLLVRLLPLVGLLLSHLGSTHVITQKFSSRLTSRDLRLLATTLNSSSSSMILSSPTSARSSAFSRSPSQAAS